MRVETYTCPDCGTVVAANVLERDRRVKCPGLDCDRVLAFEDLPPEVREHYEANAEQYRME
jgi:DNA-directed RNA polymerase subunit RPC12/RpoP